MKEPSFYKKLRTTGFILLPIGIVVSVLGLILMPMLGVNLSLSIGIPVVILGTFATGIAMICLMMGFSPKIAKLQIEKTAYIQDSSKDTLQNISSTTGDIITPAVTKTVKAVKEGLKDTKYCKYCGAEIDVDSKFCNKCGKEQ